MAVVRPDVYMRNVVVRKKTAVSLDTIGMSSFVSQNWGVRVGRILQFSVAKRMVKAGFYSLFYSPNFGHGSAAKYSIDGNRVELSFAGWFEHTDSLGQKHELVAVKSVYQKRLYLYLMKFADLAGASPDAANNFDLSSIVENSISLGKENFSVFFDEGDQSWSVQDLQVSSIFYQDSHDMLISVGASDNKGRFLRRFNVAFAKSNEEVKEGDVVVKLGVVLNVQPRSTSPFSGIYGIVNGQKFETEKHLVMSSHMNEEPYALITGVLAASPHHKVDIRFVLTSGAAENVTFDTGDGYSITLYESYPTSGNYEDFELRGIKEKFTYRYWHNQALITEDEFVSEHASYLHKFNQRWIDSLGLVYTYGCGDVSGLSISESRFSRGVFGSFAIPFSVSELGSMRTHPPVISRHLNSFGVGEDNAMPTLSISDFPSTWAAGGVRKAECENGSFSKKSRASVSRVSCVFSVLDNGFKTLYAVLDEDFFQKKLALQDAIAAVNSASEEDKPIKESIRAEKEMDFKASYGIRYSDFSTEESHGLVFQIRNYGTTYITGL